MKKTSLLLLGLFISLPLVYALSWPLPKSPKYVMEVTIDGQTSTFYEGDCYFWVQRRIDCYWESNLDSTFCGTLKWAVSEHDSLGCDSLIEDFTGKVAFAPRGACGFCRKLYEAYWGGANMVIIPNHYQNANEDACFIIPPNQGQDMCDPSPCPIPIPMVYTSRIFGDWLKAALLSGQTVDICLKSSMLYLPAAEYSYAIPVSHAGPMPQLSCRFDHPFTVFNTFDFTVDITEPDGQVVNLTTTMTLPPKVDTLITFPGYVAPPKVGVFEIVYRVDHPLVKDSLIRRFEHTPNTFATDNFEPWPNTCQFFPDIQPCYTTAVFRAGPNGGMVEAAQTVIRNNEAQINTAGVQLLTFYLSDIDPDMDGKVNPTDEWVLLALNDVEIDYLITSDQVFTAPLPPIEGNEIVLQPYHWYNLSISSTAELACMGPGQKVLYPRNPKLGGDFCSQHPATPVARLLEKAPTSGWISTQRPGDFYCAVQPNPVKDRLELMVRLAAPNTSVRCRLLSANGQLLHSEDRRDFQNGTFYWPAEHLPAGMYLLEVWSSEEGVRVIKVAK